MTKYYVICAAVSALSCLSQFCTSKKKHWNRLRENSSFRHFVTYQITFLLTCQPHNTGKSLVICLPIYSLAYQMQAKRLFRLVFSFSECWSNSSQTLFIYFHHFVSKFLQHFPLENYKSVVKSSPKVFQ